MPSCHKCPNNGKRSQACVECTGPSENQNNHGKNHVSVEEVSRFVPAPEPVQSPSEYDAAIHFIRALCRLGMIEREIVFSRLTGEEYPEITARLNIMLSKRISVQGVHARAKTALSSDKAFRKLFLEMEVKQHKRKRRTTNEDQHGTTA